MNVQEWGCFSNFLRANDVTRTMSNGGGVLVKNPVSAPGPPPLSKILDPPLKGHVTSQPGQSMTNRRGTQAPPVPQIWCKKERKGEGRKEGREAGRKEGWMDGLS